MSKKKTRKKSHIILNELVKDLSKYVNSHLDYDNVIENISSFLKNKKKIWA